jgi:CheY-like chemotaxis protein
MTRADFQLISLTPSGLVADCHQCRQPFDCMQAEVCDCVTREQTFRCPVCQACACEAPAEKRNAFWAASPPELWERRRERHAACSSRPQDLDSTTFPRPLAIIVDDDPLVRTIADRVLRNMGFSTLVTGNPEEGESLAISTLPDLVLTDALMPRMDGRQLCLNLKSDPATSGIKVIVMSALYRGTNYRNEAFREFHVDEYLVKPLKPGILLEAVQRLLPGLVTIAPSSNVRSVAS